MRSVVVKEPGQLNIESRPVPVPGAHEVRVKIAFAGICGSDVHIYHGHNPFAKYPRVIGHEFYGIIDAVGEQGISGTHRRACRGGPRCQLRPLLSLLGRKAECLYAAPGHRSSPRRGI
ncbi:putative dehydrogenase, NAD(P)-binding, starvation-sensing protein [Klebsiella pneumoniae]|nr:putative dehydrogenase, NAD(P)-binding, starvation-sensing protein [Klebsiella pneumoniae]